MLTTVNSINQPPFIQPGLKSGDMTGLQRRLGIALEHAKMNAAQLSRQSGLTPAAISKIVNGKTEEMQASTAFKVARLCRVDPEWLATGHGPAPGEKPTKPFNVKTEFEVKHLDLLRMYKRLPAEIRGPIRAMIETLAAAQREDYASWQKHQHKLAEEMDI